jgi:hypothetical protein
VLARQCFGRERLAPRAISRSALSVDIANFMTTMFDDWNIRGLLRQVTGCSLHRTLDTDPGDQ